jgi:DNA mismatch repair protein MutL
MPTDESFDGAVSPADVRVVGSLSDGYVVVETPEDVRLVDPHAVHERLIFERLSQAAEGRPAESQTLLVPETVDLTPAEAAGLDRAQEALTQLGFVAEAFGGSTVAIRAVPASIPVADAAEVLREVLQDLHAGGAGGGAKLLDRIRMSIACRAAVKLGTTLDASEIAWLIAQSRGAPGTCPHGRPFAWVIPRPEIARRLGR